MRIGISARALEDEFLHFRDGHDAVGPLDPEAGGQVGVRVGVDGEHFLALVAQGPDQKRRKRGLAHTAFAADSEFHFDFSSRKESVCVECCAIVSHLPPY